MHFVGAVLYLKFLVKQTPYEMKTLIKMGRDSHTYTIHLCLPLLNVKMCTMKRVILKFCMHTSLRQKLLEYDLYVLNLCRYEWCR